jgi:hypothetical protein
MPSFSYPNSDNDSYKDIYFYPIDNFVFNDNPDKYILTQADIDRIDFVDLTDKRKILTKLNFNRLKKLLKIITK